MIERIATHPVIWLLLLIALLSTAGTAFAWGVDDPEHPEGVSVRDGSTHFFTSYSRAHPGGGLADGK